MNFFKDEVVGIFVLSVAASMAAAFLYDYLKRKSPSGGSGRTSFFKDLVVGVFILSVASVFGTYLWENRRALVHLASDSLYQEPTPPAMNRQVPAPSAPVEGRRPDIASKAKLEPRSLPRTGASGTVAPIQTPRTDPGPVFEAPRAFFDDFNRAGSAVGNGWSHGPDNTGDRATRVEGKLTTSAAPSRTMLFRPFNTSTGARVSFALTETTGSNLAGGRYESAIWIGSTGRYLSGYGVYFSRSGNGFDNSSVILYLNGARVAALPSSFQYEGLIEVVVSFAPDGTVSGTVRGNGKSFSFNFGPRSINLASLQGSNVLIELENGNCCLKPTLGNFSIKRGA